MLPTKLLKPKNKILLKMKDPQDTSIYPLHLICNILIRDERESER